MYPSKILELAAKYKLEPSVRDVFVEGDLDRAVLSWFLSESGLGNVRVRPISAVEVPPALIAKYGLTSGERQRVIALSRELETLGAIDQATCIIDDDLDRFLGIIHSGSILLVTDYTCMEAYLFHEIPISKFLRVVLRDADVDVTGLLRSYSSILSELFLVRAALQELNLKPGWCDFTKCCKVKDCALVIDIREFIKRILEKGRIASRERVLKAKMEEMRPRLGRDLRHSIHGHDFIRLLAWDRNRNAQRRGLRDDEAMLSGLLGCISYRLLASEKLFRTCLERCRLEE